MKLAIICRKGLDNFLNWVPFIEGHEVKTFLVESGQDINQAIDWADIVWLEWMNESAVYASNYKNIIYKKVIVRCHSYEAFGFQNQINWGNIHHVNFVADHVKHILNPVIDHSVVPNGVDLEKFKFVDKQKGFNLAFVGHMNHKKGPMLLLQAMQKLVEKDDRYKLYIAGACQDLRFEYYFNHMIPALKLDDNVFFHGIVQDMPKWFEDKHYIICTSPWESQGMGIMEGMASGLKPVIHNFPSADKVYSFRYLWNTIDEFVDQITSENYIPIEYREIIGKYSIQRSIAGIQEVIDKIAKEQ